jgi:hypothetical protein
MFPMRELADAELTARNGCATPIGARCVATIKGKKKLRVVLGGGSYAVKATTASILV